MRMKTGCYPITRACFPPARETIFRGDVRFHRTKSDPRCNQSANTDRNLKFDRCDRMDSQSLNKSEHFGIDCGPGKSSSLMILINSVRILMESKNLSDYRLMAEAAQKIPASKYIKENWSLQRRYR